MHLTKSRVVAGLQCPKRLWLSVRARDLAAPPPPAQQAIFDEGTRVGEAAHALFPGGVRVDDPPWAHEEAVRRTEALMRDPAVPAIFEAAFEWRNVRVRADVLERLGAGRWGLREVKASTRVKEVHIDDVALQHWVLEGTGLSVPSVELLYVNRSYRREEGAIDWPRFFVREDLSVQSAERWAELGARVDELARALACDEAPGIPPGRHCHEPYGCEFWEHCTRSKPRDWIFHLPRISSADLEALQACGIERIGEIPDAYPLSSLQARVREVHRTGRPHFSPELARVLEEFGPPACYLDFETMNPAIPLYPGTYPYEVIPFQWSIHERQSDGRLVHRQFLADGRSDPRRECAERLLDALSGAPGPILVYTSYESQRLRQLAEALPDLAPALEALVGRLRDLFAVVRGHVYHPGFRGSFSLKDVSPVLAPCVTYADLEEISDGGAASAAMVSLARGEVSPEAEAPLRRALLAYCERDTLALVELHRALERAAA
ncbi:MAG: DUF2779 domain-containing protein [Myxococcota bacterium]